MKKVHNALSIISLLPGQAVAQENYLHHGIQATILIADVGRAIDCLALWADEAGGYLLFKSSDVAIFRFPYTEVGRLPGFPQDISETIVGLSL